MKLLLTVSRYLVGGLFIFSGLIKVNDPVGTAIKLEEYFEVFASDFAPLFELFVPAALFLSVFLSVLEVLLGIALILNYRLKLTSWILLAMIVFFTFLTFYSAYFNKVTDCGCFGDAIKLTPWESFTKDIFLLLFIGLIFSQKNKFLSKPGRMGDITLGSSLMILTFIAVYAINHLPFIDFRAYAIGNHLPSLMLPSEELRYEYIMKKDGQTESFNAYPTDPSYEFVEMILVNPEAQPKITDLGVWSDEGEYTEEMMVGTKLIFVFQNVEKTTIKNLEAMKALSSQSGLETWILTSSGYDEFEGFRHDQQLAIPYFFADATVLKTIVRSNPGIVLLSEGTVKGKWHHNDTPDVADLKTVL